MATTTLLLASGSPRRRELLAQIGVPFEPMPVDVDESRRQGETPAAMVERLARAKAAAGLEAAGRPVIALGADTGVVIDDCVLGKPDDAAEVDAMLARLSGREHEVHSGVAVATADRLDSIRVTTRVVFRRLTRAERAAYRATGEPAGKAGAYAIQGLGAVFVRHIEGSYTNVVGLPLYETARLLATAGIDPLARATAEPRATNTEPDDE